jgi:apolipoprotein N-acyltransferase
LLVMALRHPAVFVSGAVASGALGGAACNLENGWAVCCSALVALSAVVIESSPRRSLSACVVLSGAAAWHASATWWVGLAAGEGSQLRWRVAAVLIVVAAQAGWVLLAWVPVRSWALRHAEPGQRSARMGVAWVVAWSAADVVRQIGWWGDGYASVATATVGAPGVAALVPLIGAQGLSTVVLGAATLAALCLLDVGARRRHLKFLIGGAAATALLGGAFSSISWTDPRGAPQRFVVLQTNQAVVDESPDGEALGLLMRTVEVADPGSVVVAPEAFIKAPPPAQGSEPWARLRSLIERQEVHALIGIPHFARDGNRLQLLNAVLHLAPRRWALYGKERLVPGAEFQPLPHLTALVLGDGLAQIHRGESPAPRELTGPLYVNHVLVGASICHELAFAITMGERAADASMLLNASDDAWVGGSAYRAHVLNLARLRAMEFGKPVLRVTNGGESTLVDFDGQIQERARSIEPRKLEWSVVPRDGGTPYQVLMIWLAAAAMVVWLWAALSPWIGVHGRWAPWRSR